MSSFRQGKNAEEGISDSPPVDLAGSKTTVGGVDAEDEFAKSCGTLQRDELPEAQKEKWSLACSMHLSLSRLEDW